MTCVFAPACSATAVREPLVLTGKPWKRPAADVRGADPDHLLVAVDLLAGSGGEHRCRRDRVGQGDERDAERATDQEREIGEADIGAR